MTDKTVLHQLEVLIFWCAHFSQRHLPHIDTLEAVYFDDALFTLALQRDVKRLYARHAVGKWWKQRSAEVSQASQVAARKELREMTPSLPASAYWSL